MSPPRAVVLGVEHPRGVATLRALGAAGLDVVAVDHDRRARGFHSRWAASRLCVPTEPAAALAALAAIAPRGGVLIPTNDRYLSLVARHHAELARSFRVATPPWEVLWPLMHKPSCFALARAVGIATPRIATPQSLDELEVLLPALDLGRCTYIASIVDASLGDGPADTRTGRLTTLAGSDAATIRAVCHDIASRTGRMPMLAEVIPGEAHDCTGVSMVVGHRHEPILAYGVRRLQMQLYARGRIFVHPYELGANVFCESVHDPEALAAATALVRHARYVGPITVEFRRDARDGTLTLVKTDPRVVRATSLARALGMDVPLAVYRVFTEDADPGPRASAATVAAAPPGDAAAASARPALPPHREGVAWIWLTWYLSTILRARHHTPIRRQLRVLLRDLPRVRAEAYASARDPLPFLVDVWRWGQNWTGRLGARLARRVDRGGSRSDRARRHDGAPQRIDDDAAPVPHRAASQNAISRPARPDFP